MNKLLKFLKNKEGITSIEYAFLLSFIALGVVAALVALSNAVVEKYQDVTDYINQ